MLADRHTHTHKHILSAHRGKWGQLTPWKNGWKIKKRKHAKNRAVFYVICWEQLGQAVVENGAMLTTHLFRYTSECTISHSNFQNFLRLRRQGALTRLTEIPRTFLYIGYTRQTEILITILRSPGRDEAKYHSMALSDWPHRSLTDRLKAREVESESHAGVIKVQQKSLETPKFRPIFNRKDKT